MRDATTTTDQITRFLVRNNNVSPFQEKRPAPVSPAKNNMRVGRNEPCPCGSGKKFKKCHLPLIKGQNRRSPARRPKEKPAEGRAAPTMPEPRTPGKASTARALYNTGVPRHVVWAYLSTGHYMTENNKASHSAAAVKQWETAVETYEKASEQERELMLAPVTY